MEVSSQIAVLYVHFFMGEAHSLKEKRMILRRLKDKIRHSFNVSMAELDGQDKWQTCVLGFAMIGADGHYLEKILQKIFSLVESYHAVEICDHAIEFY